MIAFELWWVWNIMFLHHFNMLHLSSFTSCSHRKARFTLTTTWPPRDLVLSKQSLKWPTALFVRNIDMGPVHYFLMLIKTSTATASPSRHPSMLMNDLLGMYYVAFTSCLDSELVWTGLKAQGKWTPTWPDLSRRRLLLCPVWQSRTE